MTPADRPRVVCPVRDPDDLGVLHPSSATAGEVLWATGDVDAAKCVGRSWYADIGGEWWRLRRAAGRVRDVQAEHDAGLRVGEAVTARVRFLFVR